MRRRLNQILLERLELIRVYLDLSDSFLLLARPIDEFLCWRSDGVHLRVAY